VLPLTNDRRRRPPPFPLPPHPPRLHVTVLYDLFMKQSAGAVSMNLSRMTGVPIRLHGTRFALA
jgi:hypothetical protein